MNPSGTCKVSDAAALETLCFGFGPLGLKRQFAALVVAQDALGSVSASWTSETLFDSSDAALEHAHLNVFRLIRSSVKTSPKPERL
jgi:hypothetical protein